MKRRQILRIIPFFIALYSSKAYAQNQSNDVEQLFDIATRSYRRQMAGLWMSRAATLRDLPQTSAAIIAKILATKNEDLRMGRSRSDEIAYPDKSAVLFYSYDADNLQVWLLNEYGIQAYHKQNISKQQISNAVLRLRNSLNIDSLQRSRVPRQSVDLHDADADDSKLQEFAIYDLTQILLPTPVSNKLNIVKHLIVVPILEIGTVPYAILKPFKNDSFLIDQMSISVAPSLFDLHAPLGETGVSRLYSSPLIVGNPYLAESADWSVPSLPGAEEEAQAVAKLMKASPLLGREATKTEILSRVENASLLYFATHGVASMSNPLSGGFLMLSANKFEEGWWTAKEIQNTRLRAELAVLSACQTGLGQAHDAGIIGLARAFQIAGVPRIVMSLWSVDDQATSKLMQAFVKYLETQIPSEALRQAMLEVRQDYSELSKWASFVMFGTPR
jgi:CHAT domain-containing protein